ncbi:MAG: hypoxanthine phosphoribosyltransferase [Bacteroidales bacterium]|nr:MAG: hypoxanthine phosphoribosyltransferase [Bacteroidales bacterium]
MKEVKVSGRRFKLAIPSTRIRQAVAEIAVSMNRDLKDKNVIFLGILNGSFMFASDLIRQINFDCRISFVKLASYKGTSSSGIVKNLIGINEELRNTTAVILEDIVDTGQTLCTIVNQLKEFEPDEIRIATLLFKPEAYRHTIKLDYIGIEVPNDYIIGYGLDYNGFGRNLEDIYVIADPE